MPGSLHNERALTTSREKSSDIVIKESGFESKQIKPVRIGNEIMSPDLAEAKRPVIEDFISSEQISKHDKKMVAVKTLEEARGRSKK